MLRIRQLYIFHVSELFVLFFQENHIPKESANNFQLAISKSATKTKKITRSCLVLFEKPCSLCSPWGTMALWVGCHDLNPGWRTRPPWGLNSHWSTYGNGHEPDFVRIYIPIVRIPENWKWDFSPSPKKRNLKDPGTYFSSRKRFWASFDPSEAFELR